MAPEAYNGNTVLKSDVWSLGISLIEMADGKNPYSGKTMAVIMNRVINEEPPSMSSPNWSSGFTDFVNRCLVKDVEKRASVEELMHVIAALWGKE